MVALLALTTVDLLVVSWEFLKVCMLVECWDDKMDKQQVDEMVEQMEVAMVDVKVDALVACWVSLRVDLLAEMKEVWWGKKLVEFLGVSTVGKMVWLTVASMAVQMVGKTADKSVLSMVR